MESGNRVTVIGTGAVGGAVTRRLLQAGHDVVVWNRTGSRMTEVVAAGAVPASSVQEAMSSSPLILLTVTDYAAVRACLSGLSRLAGRTVVGIYTGNAVEARLAAERVTGLGGQYLDAGIQATPR